MNPIPNLETTVDDYYQALLAANQQAGMSLPTSIITAVDQVRADSAANLLNHDTYITSLNLNDYFQALLSKDQQAGTTLASSITGSLVQIGSDVVAGLFNRKSVAPFRNIVVRFLELLASKKQAGLPPETAVKAALYQLHVDTHAGLVDVPAAILFLAALGVNCTNVMAVPAKPSPVGQTDVSAYYQALLTMLQRQGVSAVQAKASALEQIFSDASLRLLDQDAAIQFLVSQDESGRTPAYVEEQIRTRLADPSEGLRKQGL